MAPELFTGKPYDTKVDIFSLGIIFFYLIYRKFPFGKSEFDDDTLRKNAECKINIGEE